MRSGLGQGGVKGGVKAVCHGEVRGDSWATMRISITHMKAKCSSSITNDRHQSGKQVLWTKDHDCQNEYKAAVEVTTAWGPIDAYIGYTAMFLKDVKITIVRRFFSKYFNDTFIGNNLNGMFVSYIIMEIAV